MAYGRLCKAAVILTFALVGDPTRDALAAPDCVHWLAEGFWRKAVAADVRRCVAAGARLDARAQDEGTPLHLAARFGNADAVEALIAAGAAVEARGKNGETPLHQAVIDREFVRIVLERMVSEARPVAPRRFGLSARRRAAIEDRVAKVKALIGAGAKVEARTETQGETPLHVAASSSDAETVKALVAGGARLEARDKNGLTPLHRAALWNAETVNALLDAGADGGATTSEGMNPFDLADRSMRGTEAWHRLREARHR